MIGLALGKKAVKHGYKRAGIPGAIATGSAAAVGYVVVKRALRSRTGEENLDSAIDTDRIKSAVEEQGIGAVTDRETLESAVDEGQLDTDVDMESVQSEAEDEADAVDTDSDGDATS
jgi:hypothetical protein